MKKVEKEFYNFQKKSLLLELFLLYISNVSYSSIILRSFGFEFDPTCNFKAIITSKKGNLHKYQTHIYKSMSGVNLDDIDIMGNINIIKIKNIKNYEPFIPQASLNIYFDGCKFISLGFLEGKKVSFSYLGNQCDSKRDDLLYDLNNDPKYQKINESADSFTLWLMKLYTSKLNVDLVIGAGLNVDYGGKSWNEMIDSLNNDFYKGDKEIVGQIEHYIGKQALTSSMILQTSGFDSYKSLNRELYELHGEKSFDDPDSNLQSCVDYIERHDHSCVITYNYDTNLEYLLKKRNIIYNAIYDDNSFADKDSKVDIYHVHGLLPYNKYNESKYTDSLIFNEVEYYYLYNNPYTWCISKQLHDFKFNTCIFIGISLTDPDMKRLLELANNYLKFSFIFLKKGKEYNENIFRDLTAYFFTFDLIVIWIDDYSEINSYLKEI